MGIVRTVGLKILKAVGRDIDIGHHWVSGHRIRLHSYRHKGYWWKGRKREEESMLASQRLLRPGDVAIEVGGHIGYLSSWFAHLVGPEGQLVVFEPSDDNRAYLEPNLAPMPWGEVDPRGISNFEGTAKFYIEKLTGQNNSLLKDYDFLDKNAARAGVTADRTEVSIEVTTLDNVCRERGLAPDFVKIDIEGAELSALQGMSELLHGPRPIVFVELTKDISQCLQLFSDAGYLAFDDNLKKTTCTVPGSDGLMVEKWGNYFFIHETSDRLPTKS
jgi:FkbM family methyltransferase